LSNFPFGLKRDEMAGGWRKLHSEELHNLYSLPSIIRISRRMRWVWHVACMREMRNAYTILTGIIWLRMGTGGGLL
jgi:hypothetical protein